MLHIKDSKRKGRKEGEREREREREKIALEFSH